MDVDEWLYIYVYGQRYIDGEDERCLESDRERESEHDRESYGDRRIERPIYRYMYIHIYIYTWREEDKMRSETRSYEKGPTYKQHNAFNGRYPPWS